MNKLWDKYGAEITLAGVLFVAWKCRGLLSAAGGVGDAVGAGLSGLTASVADSGKKASQRASIKAVAPNATDVQLETYEADAKALAYATGAKSARWANSLNTDWKTAFTLGKKYAHTSTTLNSAHKVVTVRNVERKDSYTLKVLIPFYSTETDGRSLTADLDNVMQFGTADAKDFYNKYIKLK